MLPVKKSEKAALIMRAEASLDSIRPFLEADGGNIELVEITDDYVLKVKLTGNCDGCPMSEGTMTLGVQETIRRDIPEIVKIETVDYSI